MTSERVTSMLEEDAALFAKLRTLGLPESISVQGFKRLLDEADMKKTGSLEIDHIPRSENFNTLRDVLSLLASHLVGKQGAHFGSKAIKKASDISDTKKEFKSKLQAPSVRQDSNQSGNHLPDRLSVALRRQDLAYRGLSAIKLEYETESRRIHELDNQNKALERNMQAKRELLSLLSILKLREETRMERLGESGIISYIRSSRKESAHAMQMLAQLGKPQPQAVRELLPLSPKENLRSHRHTNEAFAKLYQLHITQTANEKGQASSSGLEFIEEKVKSAIRRLGVTNGEESIILRRLMVLATQRISKRKGMGDSQLMAPEQELDKMGQILQRKTKIFQEKLDKAAALEWMCETHIQLITMFRGEVGPHLKIALEMETQRVDGYLDILKGHLGEESQKRLAAAQTASTSDLELEVKSIMQTPRMDVADEVENKLKRVFDSKRLIQATNPLVDCQAAVNPHQVAINVEAIIDAPRSQNLLERKSKKAEHGRVIGDDVRVMLADIKRLR